MSRVLDARVVHTADLGEANVAHARALLHVVFGDELTDSDWEHALGGLHALVWDGPELIAHAALVQRTLLHQGRALRAGYVEAVAVLPSRQGEGHGAAVMQPLERVVHEAYEIGALGAAEEAAGFYAYRGWQRWRGPTSALTPNGIIRTEGEDGSIFVLPVAVALDLNAELTCDWREGDVW